MACDNLFFKRAYELAELAGNKGFVPIGAVIVYQNTIISEAHNEHGIHHAEIVAINRANKLHFGEHIIYVTLEPCPMCMWAIKLMHFKSIFFGAYRTKSINRQIFSVGGICETECSTLLKNFFRSKRL